MEHELHKYTGGQAAAYIIRCPCHRRREGHDDQERICAASDYREAEAGKIDMRCERCQGQGMIKENWFMGQLCPECNGSGIVYCCDEGGANPPNTHDQTKDK
jgi:DnaJ-class molecular chaperone